jgi:serpin B
MGAACSASPSSPTDTTTQPLASARHGEPALAKSHLPRIPAASIAQSDVAAATAANNAFAVDLFAHLRKSAQTGNLFTSPLSASFALTMAYAGARGPTATEMAKALHLGADSARIFDGQNGLDQALESRAAKAFAIDKQAAVGAAEGPAPSPSDYDLHVVNSVWGERTYAWEQPFLDTLGTHYGTGIYLEDFVNQFDQARVAINTWVSRQTAHRINDLLPAGTLDAATRVVLVNAVHLKLPWYSTFPTSNTRKAAFTRSDGSKVDVSMMKQNEFFGYVDDGKAQIVALPLVGRDLNVVIALPHGDLASYEAELSTGSAALAPPEHQTKVALSLPKVSFTSESFSLRKALEAMGLVRAFDAEAADFSGLDASAPVKLYVSDVVQKTMLGIQETGVEAAAATGVPVFGTVFTPPTPMVVDRPFLVSIVDSTGAILFLGHIEDPTQSGS